MIDQLLLHKNNPDSSKNLEYDLYPHPLNF